MLLKKSSSIAPVADSALSEIFAEMFQDNDRPGYVNLGNPGNDGAVLYWAVSDALLNAQGGDDTIYMIGNTNDTIRHGGSGNDKLVGSLGNDTLFGESGSDTLLGGDGNDKLFGGSGHDVLDGGKDNDLLDGGTGKDQLDGGAGNDVLKAGSGNDVLKGGLGQDILTGGAGADTFTFQITSDSPAGQADVITDFERGQDMIDLRGIRGIITITSQADGQHIHIDTHGGLDMDIVVLTSDGSQLTASDFLV